MAKRGSGFVPSSPAMPPTTLGPASYETPARGASLQSHPSPSPAYGPVRLHAASPLEASIRSQMSNKPTPPPTPRNVHRDTPLAAGVHLGEPEEHNELSPVSTAANFSIAGGSQYEVSTVASEAASATKMLLRASEMMHREVKQCEGRLLIILEKEREARELSCAHLKKDFEEMVSIVEALSTQVHSPQSPDGRMDKFLEMEKRARDVLREDMESLADQVTALEDERMRAASGSPSENRGKVTALFEEERAARIAEGISLRQELEALSTLTSQERSSRDLSIAVLRKDLTHKLNSIVSDARTPGTAVELPEDRIKELLERQRTDILEHQRMTVDASCAQLRKDVEALSVVMRSLPTADLPVKCTGGTGNSEDEPGGNHLVDFSIFAEVPLAEMQHQLQERKEEGSRLESLTDQLRSELSSSAQDVSLRLEKVDKAINDLQFDVKSTQALQRCLVDAVQLAPDTAGTSAASR